MNHYKRIKQEGTKVVSYNQDEKPSRTVNNQLILTKTTSSITNAGKKTSSNRRQSRSMISYFVLFFFVYLSITSNVEIQISIRDKSLLSIIRAETILRAPRINVKKGDTKNKSRKSIPSIAFLFLVDKPVDEKMWERWFQNATDRRRYSIFVHYAKPAEHQINGTNGSNNRTLIIPYLGQFFCQYVIPSVPTAWYWMYDAQIQLLQYAFDGDSHATQFVYVSDTSIPLISFNEMYYRLIFGKYNQRREDIEDDDQDYSYQYSLTNTKSRFCLTPTTELIVKAWQYPSQALNISLNHVRKAEMWSIITRPDASILLKERSTLDLWNRTFDAEWKEHDEQVGAPGENLFPTMLYMKSSLCSLKKDCKEGMGRDCCCSTVVVWPWLNAENPVPVTVRDDESDKDIELSDSCQGWPCSFAISLNEDGLIALQKSGNFFLRKVAAGSVVVRTKRNETISLNDALPQLHQNQPMMSGARNMSDNNIDRHFQCSVSQPPSIS